MNDINFKWDGEELRYILKKFMSQHVSPKPIDQVIDEFISSHTTKEEEVGWEIECIVHGNKNYWRKQDGLYNSDLFVGGTSSQWLLNNGGKIFQVTRKSDGVVFSVGDEFDLFGGADRRYKIDKFYQNGSVMYAVQTNYPDCAKTVSLPHLIKLQPIPKRTKLFATEDGVSIYEGDSYWYVSKEPAFLSAWEIQRTNSMKRPINVYGCFSTEEKAKEYILLNKPCLSVNDVISKSWLQESGAILQQRGFYTEELKRAAKSKLH